MTTEILAPTSCPECKTSIEVHTEPKSKITTHWCTNEECKGRIRDMLTFVADRTMLEIEGLGPEMAEKLAADGYVVNLADLFEFQADAQKTIEKVGEDVFEKQMLKRGFSGAGATRMVETLERAKTAPWDRWIAALGIPMIGRRLGKVLAQELMLEEESMLRLPLYLKSLASLQVEGLGPSKTREIFAFAEDPRSVDVCTRLHRAGVRPKPLAVSAKVEGSPLAGMAFLITGDLLDIGSREYVAEKLVSLGAIQKTGVTKKVNLLIVGQEPGGAKLLKARDLGIQQVDSDWVKTTFEQYGIKTTGAVFEFDED